MLFGVSLNSQHPIRPALRHIRDAAHPATSKRHITTAEPSAMPDWRLVVAANNSMPCKVFQLGRTNLFFCERGWAGWPRLDLADKKIN